jgi:CRP/FNR family putative post-exponential-phase nitrogen-starvation transcriptional regulator
MQKGVLEKAHISILAGYFITEIDLSDAAVLRFLPGEMILCEGMPMEYLLLVISGKAKVCSTSANGKDLLLCYYISEGIIGDVELMTNNHIASTTLSAITEFLCIGLPYAKYADRLKGNLLFVNRVGRELAVKLLRNSKNSVITALHSCEERLCAYILLTEREGFFLENLTDVARSIGASYRHMLRMLSRLCSEGILRKERDVYRIIDREELIRRTPDYYLE